MKEDARTDEQKARSKRAHANSMIVMGALTTVCALAAGLIAITGGDMPDFMYGTAHCQAVSDCMTRPWPHRSAAIRIRSLSAPPPAAGQRGQAPR